MLSPSPGVLMAAFAVVIVITFLRYFCHLPWDYSVFRWWICLSFWIWFLMNNLGIELAGLCFDGKMNCICLGLFLKVLLLEELFLKAGWLILGYECGMVMCSHTENPLCTVFWIRSFSFLQIARRDSRCITLFRKCLNCFQNFGKVS